MTAIDDKYAAPGIAGLLGSPTGPEEATDDGLGRIRKYQYGAIVWHPMTGAHEVHGDIGAKWQAGGGVGSPLGYPVTDESGAANGGRFNEFMNGSIYWTPRTGAHPIPRQVFDKWATMDWESGIGYPLGDPVDLGDGEIHQAFEKAILSWGPQRGVRVVSTPAPTAPVARVFLVSWADLPPPAGYTREFFTTYFFGVGQQMTNPDGGVIPASVRDYFAHVSDGNVILSGHVDDWARSPLNISEIPHGGDHVTFPPNRVRTAGAPVTESLRHAGIHSRDQLAVNGNQPDVLVFFALDVWGDGGATRTMGYVKTELQQSGRIDLWDPGWDSFIDLPVIFASPTRQVPKPTCRSDGTFAAPPALSQIRWTGYDVVFHEFVHAILHKRGDIYGGAWDFGSWLEVMGWSVPTDYPVLMSSYVQERCGFLSIEDLPRRSHVDFPLDPLDTHSMAVRLQNGPMADAETLVIENRSRWDYSQNPPPRLTNVLLAYTIDPQRRRIHEDNNPLGRRLTGRIIKRTTGPWYDTWGAPDHPDLLGTGAGLGNTLNGQGELWWEVRNIRVQPDSSMLVNLRYKAYDLIRNYLAAAWLNGRGESITPDEFAGPKGHVMLVGRSRPIVAGQRFDKVLSVQPNWVPNGQIIADYSLDVPASGGRLYLTCALSEQAAKSDGLRVMVSVDGTSVCFAEVTLARNVRTCVIDLTQHRAETVDLHISFGAGPSATRDWAHILEAVLVPTAAPLTDLLAAASSATYRSNAGPVRLNRGGTDGAARTQIQATMQDGRIYTGPILTVTTANRNDGFLEASFPVTLPTRDAVLRAGVGFEESRQTTNNGVMVSASFLDANGTTTRLVAPVRVDRAPAIGARGVDANPLLNFAAVVPAALQGRTGNIVLRVDADGSPTEDTVSWTFARVTAD